MCRELLLPLPGAAGLLGWPAHGFYLLGAAAASMLQVSEHQLSNVPGQQLRAPAQTSSMVAISVLSPRRGCTSAFTRQ